MDFQMWLDADDIIPESELKKLIKQKQLAPDVDMVQWAPHTFDENSVRFNLDAKGAGQQKIPLKTVRTIHFAATFYTAT